jgi:hypothetical protein
MNRAVVAIFLQGSILSVPAQAAKMYWNENSTIQIRRANLNGSLVEQIVSRRPVRHVAVDAAAERLYWTEVGDPVIYRSWLDGTHAEEHFVLDTELAAEALAVDAAGGMLYVTAIVNSTAGRILRLPLSGAGRAEPLIELGVDAFAYGIAVDAAAAKIYWTQDEVTSGRVRRAALDGSAVEDLVPVAGTLAFAGIALDSAAGKMYWSARAQGRVQRADLDGSGAEDVVIGLDTPRGVALDLAKGQLYWVERFRIQRSDLNGANVEELVPFGSNVGAAAIALEFSPAGSVPALTPPAAAALVALILLAGAVIIIKTRKPVS